MRRSIRYRRNGATVEIADFLPRETLLDHLRLTRTSLGTKEGCNEGDCGACTVVLRRKREGKIVNEPVCACITLLGMVDGAEVITIEDIASEGELHPVQSAMVKHHGSQCGFCTPGIVMSLYAAHADEARPVSRETILDRLAGNLCRCTGYRPILDAATEALSCDFPPVPTFTPIGDGEDVFAGTHDRFFTAPASIDTLAKLLEEHEDATIVAGATDVGLWITKRLDDPQKIVWLGRVAGLNQIEERENALHLGATVTHAKARAVLGQLDPDLDELLRRFGSEQIRAAGTVGGNIANGSPIGDLAPALIALGATLHLRKGDVERSIPLESFFLRYGKQDREPGEFVTGLTVPKLAANSAFRALKVTKRFDEDISAVMGAFHLMVEDGAVTSARVAFGGMAATPKRASATEAALLGLSLDDSASWMPALEALASDFTPIDDMRASATYRAKVARALLFKALVEISGAETRETRLNGHREARHGTA